MADVNRGARPLSPHLQIYRWSWLMATSILTRITGNALVLAAVLVVWWFVALASGPYAFAIANGVITSWFGDVVMVAALWGLWFHTLAGVRHLIWDQGRMLEVPKADLSAKVIVGASLLLTLLTIVILRGAA